MTFYECMVEGSRKKVLLLDLVEFERSAAQKLKVKSEAEREKAGEEDHQ
jgi:hypothetical protein